MNTPNGHRRSNPANGRLKVILNFGFTWLCLVGTLALAQVPPIISYQGRVQASGTNFSGVGHFKFALVNGEGALTVTHWSNDGTSQSGNEPVDAVKAMVQDGLFQVALGDTTLSNMLAISPTVFSQTNLRLRLWFRSGSSPFEPLLPDQRFTAAGYAMFAANVPTAQINAGTITATNGLITPGTVTAANFLGNGAQLTNVLDRLTGQRGLYRVWNRVRQGRGFNVLFVGDSLIAAGALTLGNADLRDATLRCFGTNGAFGNAGGHGNLGANLVTQIPASTDGIRWFGQYYNITNLGELLFFANEGDAYCQADRISVPYLTKPGNGTLTIRAITATESTVLAVINTDQPTNSYHTNFVVPNLRYRVHLSASGGPCDVIAPGMWQAQGTGVRWGWIGQIGVDDWETGYQYWTNAMKAYQPDFVCFLQTGGDTNLATAGRKAGWALFIRDTVQNLWTNADVVVSALYPLADPNSYFGQATLRENQILREFCANYGWMYFDAYNLSPPWEVAITMPGWFFAGVHNGPPYVSYLSALLGKQLGWFDFPAVNFSSPSSSPWATVLPWARKGENVYFPSNPIASWPQAPRTPGEAFLGNSNGVLYILTSAPGLNQWSATNKLAP